MPSKKFSVYPPLDLQKPQLPKRLLLYPLEPIGIGTFYCESLTSYLNRLAAQHCVSLRNLLIAIFQMYEKQKNCLFPENFSLKTLNGLSSNAQKTIQVIESLTPLTRLNSLTMLSLSGIITEYHLLKPYRAWCPACYQEWYQQNQILYEPLLWHLKVINSCPLHNCLLVEHCPHCQGKISPNCSLRLKAGYCVKCQGWLGQDSSNLTSISQVWNVHHLKYHQYILTDLGNLIANVPYLSFLPSQFKKPKPPIEDIRSKLVNTLFSHWIFKLDLEALKGQYYYPTDLYYLERKPILKTLLNSLYSWYRISLLSVYCHFKLKHAEDDISSLEYQFLST